MRSSSEILKSAVGDATKTLQSVADLESQIAKAADLIVDCLTSGKKVLACGNGGSAADAADFCTELACRFDALENVQVVYAFWAFLCVPTGGKTCAAEV